MPELLEFSRLIGGFIGNIQAMRIFAERIGRHADEHDREVLKRFGDELQRAFPGNVKVTISDSPPPKRRAAAKKRASATRSSDGTAANEKTGALADLLRQPEVRDAFSKALESFSKEAPGQGVLLRRSALVTLMSYFEALVADLVHAYYARFPSALPAEQRSLTLAELRELGSTEEAVQYLVSQEVDAVLRESLDKQIAYFAKPLKVDTAPLVSTLSRLVEIDQRRNLVVHNRGVVNRHYLRRVAPDLLEEYDARDGERLPIDAAYLGTAMDNVFVSGLVLAMQCWSKWAKAEDEHRGAVLTNVTFEALQEARFDVVKRIATYAASGPVRSDECRRMLTINHAIALQASGDQGTMEEVLSASDWSATGLRFKLGLCSLRGEESEFFRLLPKALAADEVSRQELETWPLYAAARSFKGFNAELERLAPKTSSVSQRTVMPGSAVG